MNKITSVQMTEVEVLMAQLPLMKWNLIKSELIEMWKIVGAAGQSNLLGAKTRTVSSNTSCSTKQNLRIMRLTKRLEK